MNKRKQWLHFVIFTIMAWTGATHAAVFNTTTLTVKYDPAQTYSVTANLTASSQAPQVVAETSGPVNACQIESVTRTNNTASIAFSTQAATSTVSPIISCKIVLNQPGEGTIADATGSLNVTIQKGLQTITPQLPTDLVVGETRPIYFDSTGSANPVQISISSGNCPVNTSTNPWTIKGNAALAGCDFYVKKLGDANYADITNQKVTVAVGKGNTVVDFTNPPSLLQLPYNQSYNLIVSKTGSTAAITGGTITGSICTVLVPTGTTGSTNGSSSFSVKGSALGTCTVKADVAGTTNYNAGNNSINIQIVKANQILAISRTPTTNLEISQSATITVTSSHPGTTADPASPIVVSVADPSLCSITGTGPYTIKALKSGTCQINASQVGNTFYNPGNSSMAIPINKLQQTMSLTGGTTLDVNKTEILTITPGNSTNPPVLRVQDSSVCEVTVTSRTSATLAGKRGGTCVIRGEQLGDANYNDFVSTALLSVTITRPVLPFLFDYEPVVVVGKFDLPHVNPEAGVVFASTTPGTCSVSTDATSSKQIVTGLHVGNCTITATRSENDYYLAYGPISQTFAITQGSQLITPAVPASVTLGTPVTISANSVSGSGQQLTVSASPSGICSLAPLPPANSNHAQATLTSSTPGDCNITFVQNGTPDYAPASLTVVAKVIGSQTISFAALDPIAQNGGPLTLQATASSGLPVSYASTTPTVCNVAGNQLVLLKVGTCGLTASQDGNAYYQAATPVSQNLTILLPTSNTTVTSSANPVLQRRALTLTASVSGVTPTGNVSFLANGVAITGCASVALQNGSASCTTSALKPGLHQVVAGYSGDANNQGSQSPALTQRVQGLDWLVPLLDALTN